MIGDVQFPAGQGRWPQLAVCSQLTLHYTSPLTPHTEFLSPLKSFDDTKKKNKEKEKENKYLTILPSLYSYLCQVQKEIREGKGFLRLA